MPTLLEVKPALLRNRCVRTWQAYYRATADPSGLLLEDEAHPERLALIGVSENSRVLYTVFAELADDVVRIITARKATTHERRRYEEEGE